MNKLFSVPNILSLTRIVLTPVFIYLFLGSIQSQILAILVFTIAAITDTYDGYIARKNKMQTRLGAFLDPLADKVLILSAFSIFAYLHMIGWWVVLVLVIRDITVTQIRLKLLAVGSSLKTSYSAKLKTVFQFVGIYFLFLSVILHNTFADSQLWFFDLFVKYLIYWLVVFSIYTCIEYIGQYTKIIIKK